MRSRTLAFAFVAIGVAAGISCRTAVVGEDGPLGSSEQAAWYDAYEIGKGTPPPTYTEYAIPRHTSCAEMEIGNASAGVSPDTSRSCQGLTLTLALDDGHSAFIDFREPGRCGEFAWTSTRPIDGIVVNGVYEAMPPKATAWRYDTAKTAFWGAAPPLGLDGWYNPGRIELCYTTTTAGDGGASDGGSGDDAGTGGDAEDAGSGSSSGGKTW